MWKLACPRRNVFKRGYLDFEQNLQQKGFFLTPAPIKNLSRTLDLAYFFPASTELLLHHDSKAKPIEKVREKKNQSLSFGIFFLPMAANSEDIIYCMFKFSDVGRKKISKYSPLLIPADWFILVSHIISVYRGIK